MEQFQRKRKGFAAQPHCEPGGSRCDPWGEPGGSWRGPQCEPEAVAYRGDIHGVGLPWSAHFATRRSFQRLKIPQSIQTNVRWFVFDIGVLRVHFMHYLSDKKWEK